jgi:tetratricopeptide (TPR) repeat protein
MAVPSMTARWLAIAALAAALAASPEQAPVGGALGQAEAQLHAGNYSAALDLYLRALSAGGAAAASAEATVGWVGAALCLREGAQGSLPTQTVTALRRAVSINRRRARLEYERLSARLPVPPRPAQDEATSAEWLTQGNQLRDAAQPELACAAYRRAAAVGPAAARGQALQQLGVVLSMMRSSEGEAKHAMERAVGYQPFRADAWVNLAIALKGLGGGRANLKLSLDALSTALVLTPNGSLPRALFIAGAVLSDLGETDRAIKVYQSLASSMGNAAQQDSIYVDGLINMGVLLRSKGPAFTEAAIYSYRRALNLDPSAAIARFNLAHALHERGDLDEAVKQYVAALKCPERSGQWGNKERVDSLLMLGVSLQYQGKIPNAIKMYVTHVIPTGT